MFCGINIVIRIIFGVFKHQSDILGMLFKYSLGILYSHGNVEWMPNCSLLCFFNMLIYYEGFIS